MGTPIPMADAASPTRLFSWLSPAFPIGGFAYSQGLETAIADGMVDNGPALRVWMAGQLHCGGIRTDACFLAIAAQAIGSNDIARFLEARDLALALQVSHERHAETTAQARSFLAAAAAWPLAHDETIAAALAQPLALPIAMGAMIALHRMDLHLALCGVINAALGQQISVALRLVPLGQTEGLGLLASLEPDVDALARAAGAARMDDIASAAYGADIACQRHEDLRTRIFRS